VAVRLPLVFAVRHGAYALGAFWGLVCAIGSRRFWFDVVGHRLRRLAA
jgi:hypothetical protein